VCDIWFTKLHYIQTTFELSSEYKSYEIIITLSIHCFLFGTINLVKADKIWNNVCLDCFNEHTHVSNRLGINNRIRFVAYSFVDLHYGKISLLTSKTFDARKLALIVAPTVLPQ